MANKDLKGYRLVIYSRKFTGKTWLINHSIINENILFFSCDLNWETILPQSITKSENGKLLITFPSIVEGYGSVFRFTPILNGKVELIPTPLSSIEFIHGFNNTNFVLQAWNSVNELVLPKEIRKSKRSCVVDFHEPFQGKLCMATAINQEKSFSSSNTWSYIIGKKQDEGHMFIQLYDSDDAAILAKKEFRTYVNTDFPNDNKIEISWGLSNVVGKILPIIHGYRI